MRTINNQINMRNTGVYGLTFLVAIISACSTVEQDHQDVSEISKEQKEVIITATVESQPGTRTVLDDDYTTVLWKPADEIKVFSAGEASKFTSQNNVNQNSVNFLGTISVITGTAEGTDTDTYIYGLYPYTAETSMSGGSFTTSLPSIQTGLADSFDDDLFISIGRSYTYSMGFWNVCSGFRFSFTESGYQSVTLTSNDGTPLAGTFVVSFGQDGKPVITSNPTPSSSVTVNAPEGGFAANTWYYLVVLPGTHSEGYNFSATNASGTGTYAINEEKIFTRSRFKQIAGLDEMLSLPQTNKEIWYTSSDNKKVIPKYDNVFGAAILDNTYVNGKGIITFEDDVTSIGVGAFSGCSTLTSISIPESVTSLGNAAFYETMITEITIPSSITDIPPATFSGCSALENVNLPIELKSIGTNAFSRCTALSSIILPPMLETLDIGCFSGSGLTEITLPNSITSVGESCFSDCLSLQSVVLSSGLTYIADSMFRGCSQLSSVVIPNSITKIEQAAFWECVSLPSELTIPASVSWIKNKAFYACSSVEKVYLLREAGVTADRDAFLNCPCFSHKRIYVPSSALSKYLIDTGSNLNISYICAIEAESIEPVDLGLSVKWAPFNIGATNPRQNGASFRWGEIESTTEPNLNDYKWWNGTAFTKYTLYPSSASGGNPDGKSALELEDNAAVMNWGGVWTMPTKAQIKELIDNCSITGVYEQNYSGVLSHIVVVGPNGNSIIFPSRNMYWTKELYNHYYNSSSYDNREAYSLYFQNDEEEEVLLPWVWTDYRFSIAGIRPVYSW